VTLNDQTFEIAVAATPGLQTALLYILNEQGFGKTRTDRIASWRAGTPVEPAHLLAMVADIGKGRLSAKLKKKIPLGFAAPPYIVAAIAFVADRV